MQPLRGKVAVVAGATRGAGRGIDGAQPPGYSPEGIFKDGEFVYAT